MQQYSEALVRKLEERNTEIEATLTRLTAAHEETGAAEQRFRALIENGGDAISMLGEDGSVLYRSQASARILGYPMDELLRLKAFDLVHPEDLPRAARLFTSLLAKPAEHTHSVLRYRHKDGGWRWIESTGTNMLALPEVGAVVLNYRDVTGRKEAEDKIARLNRVHTVLSGINALILRVRDPEQLFAEACRIAVQQGQFELAWIVTYDPEASTITPVAWAGNDAERLAKSGMSARGDAPSRSGLTGRAIAGMAPVCCNDLSAEPDAGSQRRHEAIELGYRSGIGLPLIVEGAAVAVLMLYAKEPNFFNEHELKLLAEVAGNVSFALEHIARQQKVEKLSRVRAVSGEINAAIVRSRSRQELFEAACRIAVEHGKFGIAWIGTFDAKRMELSPAATAGLEDSDLLMHDKRTFRGDTVQAGGMLGRAIRERRPAPNNDITADAEMGGKRRQEAIRRGYRSAIALPLIAYDEVFGTLSLFATERGFFDDEEVTLLTEVAANISFALEHMAQQEKIEKLLQGQALLAQSLRAANEQLHEILNAMPGAVLTFGQNGVINTANDAAMTLFGHSVQEMVGQPLSIVFEPGHVPGATEIEALSRESAVFRSEKLCRNNKGECIPVLYSAARMSDADGQQPDYVCVALDVREQKQLEGELRQAQKLESVGRLASGIAHEINTPIQFVGDSVQFVREAAADLDRLIEAYRAALRSAVEGAPPAEVAASAAKVEEEIDLAYLLDNVPKSLDRALEGVGRVAAIVRAMKEFAHPDQKQMTPIDLNQAILSTLAIARNEYKYVAEVETELSELPLVTCHPGEVNQAILNVVVNAAHAIEDVVKDTERRGVIRVRTRHECDDVVISISDTGGGIPEPIRERIFDPFFTTKGVGRGTGQGLAITRSVVCEKHGGELTFDTEPGKGTTFFIRLPIDGRGPQREEPA